MVHSVPVDDVRMQHYDLICIGSGPAGEKAATQAAYYGRTVAVVERFSRPGGAMVNTGTIPSKALRETALVCSTLRRRPLPGAEFVIDHHISVPRFMARSLLIEEQEHDRIESSFDRHGIEIHHGHGHVADANTVRVTTDDGTTTTLTADHILIGTGSSPLRPDHVPFDHPSVVDADGILTLDKLPQSMIIVGAGVIGCEYASVFAEIGTAVTIIDPRHDVLPFLDVECRDRLLDSMRERGIDMRFDSTVETVATGGDDTVSVTCVGDSKLSAEVLLWAAGRTSNTTGIGLEEIGVELGRRGLVLVDEHYRTNVPSIYAAGDAIGFPALASTSMEQGRIAACHMFGIAFKTRLSDILPIGLYTIPGISMVGLLERDARKKGHDVVVGRALYRDNARSRMLGDESGILKCVFDRTTRRLLGTTIVGEDATEIIHLAQAALATGNGIDDFIDACYNFPTLTELYKYAAYDALQQLAKSPAIREAA